MTVATEPPNVSSLGQPCAICWARRFCFADPEGHGEAAQPDGFAGNQVRLRRDQHLFRQGERFQALFAIRSGCLKTTTVTGFGSEYTVGFHLPGELVGLDAIDRDRHTCNGVALTNTLVCRLPYDQLTTLACAVPRLQEEILRLISREIALTNIYSRNLSADTRLATFLIHWSERLRQRGLPHRRFVLPMYRSELGNHLRLTSETISRVLRSFARDALLRVDTPAIAITDHDGLAERAPAEMLALLVTEPGQGPPRRAPETNA